MNTATCLPPENITATPSQNDVAWSQAEEIGILKDWCLEQADGWYARGDLVPARSFLQHAADLDPKDADVWIALGSVEFALKHVEKAGLSFVNAGQLEPLKARAFLHLALTHQALGHSKEAEELFRHAVTLEPMNTMAKSLLVKFLNQDQG